MTLPTLLADVTPSLAMTVALFAAIGAVVGSFVALVARRWPTGRPIAFARSACESCAAILGPLELVPVVSYAVQRGRCRRCSAAIGAREPAIELGAAAIGAVAAALVPWPAAGAFAALGWTLVLLALLDAEHFWLPATVTWPLAFAGLAATAMLRPDDLADHVLGAVIGWGSLTLVAAMYYRLRGRIGLGGGDAVLFAASGAWLGWAALPLVLGSAAVAGIAVALLLCGRGVTATTRLPFGVFLAAATWIVALATFS
jgi:leader peptidase (prepilin peptidase)/N-methyltransferase